MNCNAARFTQQQNETIARFDYEFGYIWVKVML